MSKEQAQFEVLDDGKVIGPLWADRIRRDIEAGKISANAEGRPLGELTWVPLNRLVTPRPLAPKIEHTATETPYKNLTAVSKSVITYGEALKIISIVVVVGGGIAIVGAFANPDKNLITEAIGVIGLFALFFGAILYSAGMMIAAMGEAMHALRDIAMNTRAVADREKH